MNKVYRFNDQWAFAKTGLEAEQPGNEAFEAVSLPHDWLIWNAQNLYENSIGWYRRTLETEKDVHQTVLRFDGVYMNSALYVNGQLAGEWKYGYSTFEHDITPFLRQGSNELLLKVVHESPNSRWYSGAGIYRDVWLLQRGKSYIESDGIYVRVRQQADDWQVRVSAEVNAQEDVRVTHTLLDGDQVMAVLSPDAPGGTVVFSVAEPRLWSPETPALYTIVTELRSAEGQLLEQQSTRTGFRTVVMDPAEGLILNGRKIKFNGVCEHHDLGALGAAFNPVAMRRRFEILRKMGVNAIRTAHNMPAPEFMDLADEMGLMVQSEAFDMWERPKTPFDYARFFPEWAGRDVASWVRRDRNHVSLVMWSIGNEIYDTHAGPRGEVLTQMLMGMVADHDPEGNAPVTIGSNYMPWENAQKCADIVKLAGYNYAEKYYQKHHEAHPDWIIYGSETSSVVQSRGIYHFPFSQSLLADDDEQCSSLGNSPTSWGAKSPEACILAERDLSFSLGQFLWTGFDYIGEPTPYHTRNSYFGQIDTAGFPKDAYYIYQAAWTDYRTNPMVHVFPHWDFNPGQLVDVRVCSNAPEVELWHNGVSQGRFRIDHDHGRQLLGHWQIPYAPGEICAAAYDDQGREIAREVRHSFGEAAEIAVEADKLALKADATDMVFLDIRMRDAGGYPVENAAARVHVAVSGAAVLLGLDNGDSTDKDPYKGSTRRLFSGKLLAMVGAGLESGPAWVTISSEGMKPVTVELRVEPVSPEMHQGRAAAIGTLEKGCMLGRTDEVPMRKIQLTAREGQVLSPGTPVVEVEACVCPANASYADLVWSVVDAKGIPSGIARAEVTESGVRLTGVSDGAFMLRCTSCNGSDKVRIISQLEFTVEGMGTACKDPYSFISAGRYDVSYGEVGNGNERGVATSRDGETMVGFRDIDFGTYGSDTVILPVFNLVSTPCEFEIWEGIPGESGSQCIDKLVYQKESRWNVYQEETYTLSRRLRGITTLCFVFRMKVHLRGFRFQRQNRAFAMNAAREADKIYGDTFRITDMAVAGIGNNVSLVFEAMDFSDKGTGSITLFGKSNIDVNTIHIRFEGENGESAQMAEVQWSEEMQELTFPLERICGLQKVTFIFLPGCDFDFGWFRMNP